MGTVDLNPLPQHIENLLIQFLTPDNVTRRQAEDQIKLLCKDPKIVPILIEHLRIGKTPNVRQLSAVLLRKKITGHWGKLSPQLKSSVKATLIDSITHEHRCVFQKKFFLMGCIIIFNENSEPGGFCHALFIHLEKMLLHK